MISNSLITPIKLGYVKWDSKNEEGFPVKNALVQVFDSGDEPVTHGFTNDDGQYRFYLEHGNYILKAVR